MAVHSGVQDSAVNRTASHVPRNLFREIFNTTPPTPESPARGVADEGSTFDTGRNFSNACKRYELVRNFKTKIVLCHRFVERKWGGVWQGCQCKPGCTHPRLSSFVQWWPRARALSSGARLCDASSSYWVGQRTGGRCRCLGRNRSNTGSQVRRPSSGAVGVSPAALGHDGGWTVKRCQGGVATRGRAPFCAA